jgi:diguanylate cyclase (GGDEF)-like protein
MAPWRCRDHAHGVGTSVDVSEPSRSHRSPADPDGGEARRLEAELERRRDELEMLVEGQRRLLEVSRGVLASLDPSEVLGLIADSLKALIAHDILVISEVDWTSRSFTPTLARTTFVDSDAAATFLATPTAIESGIAGWVIRTGEPINLVDAHEDPRGVQIPGTAEVPEQVIVVPLVRHGAVAGTLKVSRRALSDQAFTEAEFDLVQLFGSLASIAIQNAQAHRAVVSQADTDALTGLLNHGAFQRDLHQRLEDAPAETLALVLLDLDRFKAFNDTHGHAAGDDLLARTAGAIRAAVREGDRAYRYGGDEFTILLPRTDRQGAQSIADRITGAIRTLTEGAPVLVTASAGFACWPQDASSAKELIEIADRRQYAAKSARAVHRDR